MSKWPPRKYATMLIAASDAKNAVSRNADIICDGTNDHLDVLAAVAELPVSGGLIQLSEGNFSFNGENAIGTPNITIRGMGRGSTLVRQLAAYPAFDFGINDEVMLSDMQIRMPTSSGADAVQFGGATQSRGHIAARLRFAGGQSDKYCIRLTNVFEPSIRDINQNTAIGMTASGILVENTANDYNYGNGEISNVSFTLGASTKGISLVGAATKNVNLMRIGAINLVTAAGAPNGIVGIYLNNAPHCSFTATDLEQLQTGIQLIASSNCVFQKPYFYGCTTDFNFNSSSYANRIIGGNPSTVTGFDSVAYLAYQNTFLGPLLFKRPQIAEFYDDFMGSTLSPAWTTGGTNGTVALSGGDAVLLSVAGNVDDTAFINFGGARGFCDTNHTYFEAKIQRGGLNNYIVYLGLVDGGFVKGVNIGSWMYQDINDAVWHVVCGNGALSTDVATSIARSQGSTTFSILKTFTGVNFYNNGIQIGTIATNNPDAATLREPMFMIQQKGGEARSLTVEHVYVAMGRKYAT